jgi:hypothetical protein
MTASTPRSYTQELFDVAQAHDFDMRFHDVEVICQGPDCGQILLRAEWAGE